MRNHEPDAHHPSKLLAAVAALGLLASPVGATELISTTTTGGDAGGQLLDLSPDGRYVLFTSDSDSVVVGDTNGATDVFLRDRLTGRTLRASVGSSGAPANNASLRSGSVSSDGRYIAFASSASNLVAGDSNGQPDIFLRDTLAGTTERVSLSPSGMEANGASRGAFVSDDGRYVLFGSAASNLIVGYGPPKMGVYLRDRLQRTTVLVSFNGPTLDCAPTAMTRDARVATFVCGGIHAYWRELPLYRVEQLFNNYDGQPARPDDISNDGRFITVSTTRSLLAEDTNDRNDVYLFDRTTGEWHLISVTLQGATGLGYSDRGTVSDDGRYVAFLSFAAALVPGDTNGLPDVFVRDRTRRLTTRVSVASSGAQANGASTQARISGDGTSVVFQSQASNLTPTAVTRFENIYFNANVAPTASFSLRPASLGFGAVRTGTVSAGQTIIVSNTGVSALEIKWIGLAGVNAADFSRTRQCPGYLLPSASCTVTVTFAPQSVGAKEARLVVSAGGLRRSSALSGTGQ